MLSPLIRKLTVVFVVAAFVYKHRTGAKFF